MPYYGVEEEDKVTIHMPTSNDLPPIDKWASFLIITPEDFQPCYLIDKYCEILYEAFKEDTESINYLIEIIRNYWIKYLYPELFLKYDSFNEKLMEEGEEEKIGCYPYCPPMIHVHSILL